MELSNMPAADALALAALAQRPRRQQLGLRPKADSDMLTALATVLDHCAQAASQSARLNDPDRAQG
jgi:hypothetical protein